MKRIILILTFLGLTYPLYPQATKSYTATEIFEKIQRLQVLGSVLYVAAHPDDENTRLISYLSNEKKYETTYLSLTRGDGGQNLIGPEIQELLGVIRTQELLAARRVDGGKQMFSRANDFGYSKNPYETLEIWNKDEVLSDVIWAIRKLQPDVIINRFSNDPNSSTHGHHTASAMLATEAFDMTNDPAAYPEQLAHVQPWKAERLMWNTGWWFFRSRENFDTVDKSQFTSMDVGVYYPLKGKSNTEIAAESRSQHQCQGMGSTPTRGASMEYLQHLKGSKPAGDLFSGINTGWSRLNGGAPIGQALAEVEQNFDFAQPSKSIRRLMKIRSMISELDDSRWKTVKLEEIEDVILGCLGMFAEVITADYSAHPGGSIGVQSEIINRSNVEVYIKQLKIPSIGIDTSLNLALTAETPFKWSSETVIPKDAATTNSYWLNEIWDLGMYEVEDQTLRGLPETPSKHTAFFQLNIGGTDFTIKRPLVYKRTDRVKGETYRPFEIIPPVSVSIENDVEIFVDNEPRTILVGVKAGKDACSGSLTIAHPDGWSVSPEVQEFTLSVKGEKQFFEYEISPPTESSVGLISPIATVEDGSFVKEEIIIAYDHIPTQTIYKHVATKVVKIDLKTAGQNVGYIMGSGDAIPASLEQIGYRVELLNESDIQSKELSMYDAIILGIRAYNTQNWLKYQQKKLMDYVKNGGTMIVQYNTSRGLATNELGPFPFKLSRDRVSVENAPVTILAPEHPVLNYPNKITQDDFDGWIQERGLYFSNEWDERYVPIISSNDPGEPARNGGFLVAEYGQGYYVYSGYSWFRELPAGVPGAFRIFANIVSLGKTDRP